MLPSLCLAMAANPSVSRISEGKSRFLGVVPPGGTLCWAGDKVAVFAIARAAQRLILGFHAASWQHRYLDCGTLFLSGRCGRGTPCRGRRQVAARKEPPVAGACMVGEVLG